MAEYIVSVDGEGVGNMKGFQFRPWQLDRMKATFAKEWGISPKGITITPAKTVRVKFEGKVS